MADLVVLAGPLGIVGAADRVRDAGDGDRQVDERDREVAQLQVACDVDRLPGPDRLSVNVDGRREGG